MIALVSVTSAICMSITSPNEGFKKLQRTDVKLKSNEKLKPRGNLADYYGVNDNGNYSG